MATSESSAGPSAARSDATAIIVNHDSGDRLGPLLDVLEPQVRRVVVVDNASTDGSLRHADGRASVEIVRNRENRGFAAAVNQGAALADGDWLVLVNPDTHLDPDHVARLIDGLPADVAAAAPLQVDAYGRPRPETAGFDPTILRYLAWAVLPARVRGHRGPWLGPPYPSRDVDVDWASGALLAIRRRVFEELGRHDERFFLYHEDVEFGRRARRAGYRIVVRGGVRLHHEVAHGDPERRVTGTLRSIESLAVDMPAGKRRPLGAVLALGYGVRALFGGPQTRRVARAGLGHALTLVRGRIPVTPRPAPPP